jgi:predicted nucleotidyltransferase
MLKRNIFLLLTVVLALALSGCSNSSKEVAIESKAPPKDMVDQVLEQIEQPALMEMPADMIQTLYHLDPALLDQYTIRMPLMNMKTNEIAILKVKEAKDIATVETAVKQRAADVQKQFETYLQDQYENAKNYKLVTKGNYVLFVISENADEIVKVLESFFETK